MSKVAKLNVFKSFEKCYHFLKNAEISKNMQGKKLIIGGSQLYNYVYDNYHSNLDIIYETFINYSFNTEMIYNFEINCSKLNFKINTDKLYSKITYNYIDDENQLS